MNAAPRTDFVHWSHEPVRAFTGFVAAAAGLGDTAAVRFMAGLGLERDGSSEVARGGSAKVREKPEIGLIHSILPISYRRVFREPQLSLVSSKLTFAATGVIPCGERGKEKRTRTPNASRTRIAEFAKGLECVWLATAFEHP